MAGTVYQGSMDGPTHGQKSLAIELPYEAPDTYGALFVLPQASDYADFELGGLTINETTADHSSFDARSAQNQKRRQISRTRDLVGSILINASDAGRAWNELKATQTTKRDTRFMAHEDNNTLTPEAGSPLLGGFLSVKPYNTDGVIGNAWTTDFTHYINGDVEALEAVLAAPGDLAVNAGQAPTSTTISVQWSGSSAKLATNSNTYETRGFVIYYRKTGDVVWIRANAIEEANAGGNLQTYEITGLVAATSYDIAVAPVWFFGKEFPQSATVPLSTAT